MRGAVSAFVGLVLGACTYRTEVPPVDGSALASVGARQPGHYAALVQTGGWNMTTEITGPKCSLNSYEADLNPTWDQAMRGALAAALEKVDFVSSPLPGPELAKRGYDAEIGVLQSNARIRMGIVSHYFSGEAISEASLDGILTISYPDGAHQQEAVHGQGTATQGGFTCGDVGPAVANAGASAVRDIVERATTAAKLLLAQRAPH